MLLHATDLTVRHHPSHPPVLDGVSVSLAPGELLAVVGGNGSGKSTLGRALAGLAPLERGRIAGAGRGGRAPRVGLVLQDPAAQLVAATVADEIALGPQSAGLAPAQVAQVVGDSVARAGLDAIWHRDPARVSGGQQQRVAIAAIDACDVDVLVLDEPTAMLDAPSALAFTARVRAGAGARGIIWITQVADEVAACDRVLVLDAGVAAWEGTVDDYVATPDVAATFGLDLPVAARIAHELGALGAWPDARAIPSSLEALERELAR